MDYNYSQEEHRLATELFQENNENLVVIARARRRRSNRDQSLSTNDILHERFIRLNKTKRWESQEHFINAAALAIRHVVIDYARRKRATKRHGVKVNQHTELLPESLESSEQFIQILDLIDKFKTQNVRWMRIFDARYFCGFTEDATDLSP